MVREETNKKSNCQTGECVACSMDQNWKSRSKERKARMGKREAQIIMLGEYKETITNARRKLEVRTEAVMLCMKGTKKRSSLQETEAKSCEFNKFPKTKQACIGRSHRKQRIQFDESLKFGTQSLFQCLKR